MTASNIDDVRRAALDRVETSRKTAIGFMVAGGIAEGAIFVTIVFRLDWADPLHLVIFLCACLVYVPLAFGLLALRAYTDLSARRVLAAVELARSD